jgi:hypothetical protein
MHLFGLKCKTIIEILAHSKQALALSVENCRFLSETYILIKRSLTKV